MSYHQGFSTRPEYDPCAYAKELSESTGPYAYQMYDGKYEHCEKCVYDEYTRPFDGEIVDVESELRNQTRVYTRCPTRKYNPKCKKSSRCISTFSPDAPVVLAPEVCPIVYNNLTWGDNTGIRDPKPSNCKGFRVSKRRG
jgi:hypothetical protein